jgi:dTDP-4-amino-4,6-dideoxygalactose transaminase
MIPVFKPCYDQQELEALREPFESGWIGLGPKTKEFEERLGHQFKEIKWLDQALTHKSFVYETNRSEKTANESWNSSEIRFLALRSAPSSSNAWVSAPFTYLS